MCIIKYTENTKKKKIHYIVHLSLRFHMRSHYYLYLYRIFSNLNIKKIIKKKKKIERFIWKFYFIKFLKKFTYNSFY